MNNKLRYSVMHYGLCVLIFFLLYILQSTPGMLEFWGYKPLLLAPCMISVAMLEQEYAGALFGAFAGALCDLNANTYFGFNAMMFMLCGLAVGLLCEYMTQRNLRNGVLFTAAFVVVLCSINHFFQIGVYRYPHTGLYWIKKTAGTLLTTAVFAPFIYMLFDKINKGFEKYKEL